MAEDIRECEAKRKAGRDEMTVLAGPHNMPSGHHRTEELTHTCPQMQTMLNSPQFLQQMSSVMSNPAVLDQILASNPQLAAMGPQVREVFRSERFRQMMSNPDTLRMMLQMSSLMRDDTMGGMGGMGGFGGAGGFGAGGGFPAPGLPSTARQQSTTTPPAGSPPAQAPNPFMNPFFPTPPSTTAPASGDAGAGAGATGAAPPAGLFDPAMMQQMLAALGGGAGAGAAAAGAGMGASPFGMGGLGGLGAFGGPPVAPADSRPPEERFQVQLQVCALRYSLWPGAYEERVQQLQDMGFTNASQNVRALLATGGNVHSAIEYILNGGGL